MSITLGNQLELYKLLIYKEGNNDSEKKIMGGKDGDYGDGYGYGYGYGYGEGEGEEGEGEEGEDGEGERDRDSDGEDNGVIQEEEDGSKNSLVSIQMEDQVKK